MAGKKYTYQDQLDLAGKKLDEANKFDWLIFAITTLRDADLIKDLISEGACVNIPEDNPRRFEFSPLHMCADGDFVEGVAVLIGGGAEVDLRSSTGACNRTPLHHAVQEDNLPVVKELMSYGADPYCLLWGESHNKPLSWDCFELAEVHGSDKMKSYFRKCKLFEEMKLKLSHLYWREEPNILEGVWWPTAVYLNGKIFVGGRWRFYVQCLYVFNLVSRKWSKVFFRDSCEMSAFTLVTTRNQVHTLGGMLRKDDQLEEYLEVVFTLDENLRWCNTLPPLNIGRIEATSTTFEDRIVVAGGESKDGQLSSVEVLDSLQPSSTWWKICDLPVKSSLMQCTIIDNKLFIGCGLGTDNIIYTAKLSAIKDVLLSNGSKSSVPSEAFWQALPNTPLRWCGLVAVNNYFVAVGGCDDDDNKFHSSVNLYDDFKKTWIKVSDTGISREAPAVVFCVFENKQELFVICGGVNAQDSESSVQSCDVY